jgi:hypothetical protein
VRVCVMGGSGTAIMATSEQPPLHEILLSASLPCVKHMKYIKQFAQETFAVPSSHFHSSGQCREPYLGAEVAYLAAEGLQTRK